MPTPSEQYIPWLDQMERERDELRETIQTFLRAMRAEGKKTDELRAEVERLTGFVAEMQPELGKLKTEVERLRAALAEIADLELEGDASVGDAIVIADEALNPPPDDLVSDKECLIAQDSVLVLAALPPRLHPLPAPRRHLQAICGQRLPTARSDVQIG